MAVKTETTEDWAGMAYGILFALALSGNLAQQQSRELLTFLDAAPKSVVTSGARLYAETLVSEFGN